MALRMRKWVNGHRLRARRGRREEDGEAHNLHISAQSAIRMMLQGIEMFVYIKLFNAQVNNKNGGLSEKKWDILSSYCGMSSKSCIFALDNKTNYAKI